MQVLSGEEIAAMVAVLLFFFFQAEDGIRDLTVTGVQTCALPISSRRPCSAPQSAATSYTIARSSSGVGKGSRKRAVNWSRSAGTSSTEPTSTTDRKSVG